MSETLKQGMYSPTPIKEQSKEGERMNHNTSNKTALISKPISQSVLGIDNY